MKKFYVLFLGLWAALSGWENVAFGQACPASGLTATPTATCPNTPVALSGPPGFANYAWNCDGCAPGNPTTAGPTNVTWPTPGIKTVSLVLTTNALAIPQQTFNYAGPSVAIPDNSCAPGIATINVAGYPGNVPPGMSVTITNITHTFDGDLFIFLMAPNGNVVELSTANGGAGDNYTNTVFNDGAGTAITAGVAPFTGAFRPEALTAGSTAITGCAAQNHVAGLNGLAGSPANGAWTLIVIDRSAADVGNIVGFNITFPAQNVPAQVCPALTQTVTVANVPVNYAFTVNDPICEGQQLNFVGDLVPGATYNWLGPNGFVSNLANPIIPNATTNASGVYQSFVNFGGCNSNIAVRNVVVNPRPATPPATAVTPICEGQPFSLNTPDLGPGFTYTWVGPNGNVGNTPQISLFGAVPGNAGIYSVTVTNSFGCTSLPGTATVVVTPVPAAPAIGFTPPPCVGQPLQLTASSIPGALYSWSNAFGFTSNTQNPIIPNATLANGGTYFLHVVVNGCASTDVFVDVNMTDVQFLSPPTNFVVCEGNSLNMVFPFDTATAISPVTVQGVWVRPDGSTVVVNTINGTDFQLPITAATIAMDGTHTLLIDAGGCQIAQQFIVDVVTPIVPVGNNGPFCEAQLLQLTAGSLPNASYNWTGPNGFTANIQNPQILSATTLNAGQYCVVVTDTPSGCASPPQCTNVVINPTPAAPFTGSNTPICEGQDLTLTAADVPGAVSYSWTGPNSFTSNMQNPTIVAATTAASGTYSVFAVTALGCVTSSNTITVAVNPNPPAITLTSNSPVCVPNDIDLFATQVANATYLWSGPGFSTNSSSSSIQTTAINVGSGGTYSVIVQTPAGCTSAPATTNVVVFPGIQNPILAGNNSPVCSGQSLTLTADPIIGATYNWVGPNGFSSNQQNPVILNATTAENGQYVVTVTDANGCSTQTVTTNATIIPVLAPITIFGPTVYCFNQTINLLATPFPGAQYSWFGPNNFSAISSTPNQSIPFATDMSTGTYGVFATVQGCNSPIATIDITVRPMVMTPTVSNNTPICAGTQLNLVAFSGDPGATFVWTGPNAFSSNVQSPNIPNAGTQNSGIYTVFTIVNGCTSATASTNAQVVQQPLAPQAGSNSPICEGQQLNLTAETLAGVTYQWTGPNAFSSNLQNPVVTVSATTANAGIYNVVAVANNLCFSPPTRVDVTVNVSEPVTAGCANCPVCYGTQANLTGSQVNDLFAFYTWSGPNGYFAFQQNPTIPSVTPLEAGVYTLTVTFSNGCQRTVTVPVTLRDVALPQATITAATPTVCAGAPATLIFQVTGKGPWTVTYFDNGNPQIISLGNSAQVGPLNFSYIVTPFVDTDYVLSSIQDGFGCTNNTIGGVAKVAVIPQPTAVWNTPLQTICPNASAVLTFALTGKGPWLVNYDANGVAQPQQLFGGTASPSPSTFSLTVTPSFNTTYTFTSVVDANGCAATTFLSTAVNISTPPLAILTSSSVVACSGQTLAVDVLISGRGPWTLTYLLGASLNTVVVGTNTSPDPSLLNFPVNPAINTTLTLVTVTDAFGCSGLADATPLTITVLPGVSVATTVTNVSCSNATGTIDATATGGVGGYSFSLNGGAPQLTGLFTNLAAGTYTVTVTDANGCSAVTPVLTVQPIANPTNVTVTNISSTTALVTWTAAATGVRYTVSFRPAGSTGPFTSLINIPGTSTTLTGLTPNTQYEVMVQAVCINNGATSPFTPPTNFTTLPVVTVCPQPTNLTATVSGSNAILVTWVAGSASSACYDLQYRILPNGAFTTIAAIAGTSQTINGLLTGASYQVKVRANCNACGAGAIRSSFTLPVSVTLPANTCPTGLSIGDGSSSIIVCGASTVLNANVSGGVGPFSYQWRLNGVDIPGATSNLYTATASGTYTVVVTAANCTALTSAPVVVTLSNFSFTLVTNSFFTSCVGCSDGSIQATALTSGQGTFGFQYSLSGAVNRPFQTSNTFTNLPAGNYVVTAREITTGCTSSANVTVCNPPVITQITNILRTRANVAWTTSTCAVSYNLRYRPVGSTNWTTITNAGAGTRLITGLTANTTYEVQVQAVAQGGQLSVFSPSLNFTTAARYGAELNDLDDATPTPFSLYPNPSSGRFTLSNRAMQNESYRVTVLDMSGRKVLERAFEAQIGPNEFSLEIETAGVYVVEIANEAQTVRERLRVVVR